MLAHRGLLLLRTSPAEPAPWGRAAPHRALVAPRGRTAPHRHWWHCGAACTTPGTGGTVGPGCTAWGTGVTAGPGCTTPGTGGTTGSPAPHQALVALWGRAVPHQHWWHRGAGPHRTGHSWLWPHSPPGLCRALVSGDQRPRARPCDAARPLRWALSVLIACPSVKKPLSTPLLHTCIYVSIIYLHYSANILCTIKHVQK